jgi:hypothetical protein
VIFLDGTYFLGLLWRDATEYVLCLVHAALRSLLLVLVISQMSSTGGSIGLLLLLLVLL